MTENTTTTVDLTGKMVRCNAAYPEYARDTRDLLVGKTGTCTMAAPDTQGDIMVRFDETIQGSQNWYVRDWTVLGEDGLPVEDAATPAVDDDPTVSERRLSTLIDAIYTVAARRGYGHLIPDLFEEVGIPLRPSERTLTITLNRVVDSISFEDRQAARARVAERMNAEIAGEATINHVDVMERVQIVVPYPETNPAEDQACRCYNAASEVTTDKGRSLPVAVQTQIAGALGHRRFDSYTVGGVLARGESFNVTCTYCR